MANTLRKIIVAIPVVVLTWIMFKARFAYEFNTVGLPVLGDAVLNLLPLYAFILYDLIRRQAGSWLVMVVQASFYVYILSVLYLTVYFIPFTEMLARDWLAFLSDRFSLHAGINVIPFTIFTDYNVLDLQVIGNLLMLAPLGIYLPLLYRNMTNGLAVLRVGLLVAVSIELIQLFTGFRSVDIDDVILNSTGSVLGYLILPKELRGRKIDRAFT